ncbi:MAG: hypothetical protein HY737_00845 [Candidatus Omnitrophica bacterium]|nr:hypothetical protein [Candidatus Omnitrophota bacterium]
MTYFVEHLTFRTWGVAMLPRLLMARLRGQRRPVRCYVIEGSRLALQAARVTGRLIGITPERLQFRLMEIRDDAGLSIRVRLAYRDLAEVQADAMREPDFIACQQRAQGTDRLLPYLAKGLAAIDRAERGTLWRRMLTTQICARHISSDGQSHETPVVVMERQPWHGAIERYANRHGLRVIPVTAGWDLNRRLRRLARRLIDRIPRPRPTQAVTAGRVAPTARPRIGLTFYGQLNLKHPGRYSDLFFLQQSAIRGSDTVLFFEFPQDPLDMKKAAELAEEGIEAVVLNPRAATLPKARVWSPRRRVSVKQPRGRSCESAWLAEQAESYHALRASWRELCAAHRVKIYLTWYKYDGVHAAIADALRDLGGILAVYQRAYEGLASAETTVNADIMFGFSTMGAEVEQRSGSTIAYHVTTGYVGDHRVSLWRGEAMKIRQSLQQRGARQILAFADESTKDDARWAPGHPQAQRDYAFLLERVLNEPWLGLVVKPKRPVKLRPRLGAIAQLLARAEATGRCIVLEGGILHGSVPPAAAALAADVMIHGHLYAATAGVESALAGVPTLLLDHEGWAASPLYRLGVGQVVFHDWESLWKRCREHWHQPGGVPGFGDWSSMLDELDPFRDGRAAERLSTYLQWLLEGFAAGASRETVMADAAQRYALQWGHEMVTSVNAAGSIRYQISNRGLISDIALQAR